jgi:NADH-quinone oxidoreductase subunit N
VLALLFVFAGFAFKISAVPFHFWAPDVYQGAPAAIAGFLAVASKAAGFAALVRFAGAAGTHVEDAKNVWVVLPWDSPMAAILAVSAVVTMTVGNLAACRQSDLKRLLAWSSIAHAGYMLMALSVWSRTGVEAVVFYLVTYLFMNLAAFLLAGVVARDAGTSDMSALRGLAYRHPWLAGALAIVMLSLTGLPPMLGFLGKWVLFAAVLERGYLWLAVIGLLNGAISLYYYAHPLYRMYFQDADPARPVPEVRPARAAVVLACVLVVPLATVFLYWNPLIEWVRGIVPAGMFT